MEGSLYPNFPVNHIEFVDLEIEQDQIVFQYRVDGFLNTVLLEYQPGILQKVGERAGQHDPGAALQTFAATLGVIGGLRYGAVLPRVFDFSRFEKWVLPETVPVLQTSMPRHWSEHRFQLNDLAYQHPELHYDVDSLGSHAVRPIWVITPSHDQRKVMIASGSGKDSLLCSLLIKTAQLRHDLVTYLFDLYGDLEKQHKLFVQVNDVLTHEQHHLIRYHDDYYGWLDQRMKTHGISPRVHSHGIEKPFRIEAGEVYFMSIALVPVQAAENISIQLFGNEKSADAPNLRIPETDEPIAHQWAKSVESEHLLSQYYQSLFQGIDRVSLTKAVHDLRIFEALFRLGGNLPYGTNSCNIEKPWCGRCEKCAYVFVGFSAFGDHQEVVWAFGEDLFNVEANTKVWEELLGLHGYIPWECVGQPEEVQYYFYRSMKRGCRGLALEIFRNRVLPEIGSVESYFSRIEQQFGAIYDEHHRIPDWIWAKVRPQLDAGPIQLSG